jgi:hypothetical protein
VIGTVDVGGIVCGSPPAVLGSEPEYKYCLLSASISTQFALPRVHLTARIHHSIHDSRYYSQFTTVEGTHCSHIIMSAIPHHPDASPVYSPLLEEHVRRKVAGQCLVGSLLVGGKQALWVSCPGASNKGDPTWTRFERAEERNLPTGWPMDASIHGVYRPFKFDTFTITGTEGPAAIPGWVQPLMDLPIWPYCVRHICWANESNQVTYFIKCAHCVCPVVVRCVLCCQLC